MQDFQSRLTVFLMAANESQDFEQLSQDASTREYFRIEWNGISAIACVYPEPFIAAEHAYIDVTKLFLKCGLPVANILAVDENLGVMILEDFGDRILRDVLLDSDETKRNELMDKAISLIPRIQAATKTAFEINSIASRLKFDTEKLLWELRFFKEHYFGTLMNRPLSPDIDANIDNEFLQISKELEAKAKVLCHRDFHTANLMLDPNNGLRIIDHQDARLGSAAYDLVSFLLDRVTEPPSKEWIISKQKVFLSWRVTSGLDPIDPDEFAAEFRLQTIQRCLKAAGTFSFQSATRGKVYFLPYIQPMFRIVSDAVAELDRFPNLSKVINEEIPTNIEHAQYRGRTNDDGR